MARFNRISGKGGSLLDSGVAALAALSGGFVTYAMPEGLFSRIVVASHLPQFLAAAQPPLGMKARLAAIAVAALIIYALVWTLLRALDSVGGRKRPAAAEAFVPEDEEAPRLRRADAHPDAPSRRPIFAGRDLGEPEFEEAEFEEAPLELAPDAAIAPEPEPEFEPAPEFEAEAEPEIAAAPEPEPEVDSFPAFLVPQQQEPEPEPTEEPAPPVFAEPSFHASYDEFGEPAEEEEEEEGEEEETSETDADDQSLARLMQRFESGLGRKQQALQAAPPAAIPPAPPPAAVAPEPEPMPVPQERVGHRLRSAISDLNKMSGSGR